MDYRTCTSSFARFPASSMLGGASPNTSSPQITSGGSPRGFVTLRKVVVRQEYPAGHAL